MKDAHTSTAATASTAQTTSSDPEQHSQCGQSCTVAFEIAFNFMRSKGSENMLTLLWSTRAALMNSLLSERESAW